MGYLETFSALFWWTGAVVWHVVVAVIGWIIFAIVLGAILTGIDLLMASSAIG